MTTPKQTEIVTIIMDDASLDRGVSFLLGSGRLEGDPPHWAIRQLVAELLRACGPQDSSCKYLGTVLKPLPNRLLHIGATS